jgi:hypothetical protein
MREIEALMEIQHMSIGEKIVALSQTEKAYVRDYVERAIFENQKRKQRSRIKKVEHRENK